MQNGITCKYMAVEQTNAKLMEAPASYAVLQDLNPAFHETAPIILCL